MTYTEGAVSLEGLEKGEKATHVQVTTPGAKMGDEHKATSWRGRRPTANHPEGFKGQSRIFSRGMTCILETSLLSMLAVWETNF